MLEPRRKAQCGSSPRREPDRPGLARRHGGEDVTVLIQPVASAVARPHPACRSTAGTPLRWRPSGRGVSRTRSAGKSAPRCEQLASLATSGTPLQITRPRRSPNPSLATSRTPNSGLEISAGRGVSPRASQNAPTSYGRPIGASVAATLRAGHRAGGAVRQRAIPVGRAQPRLGLVESRPERQL